MGVVVYNIWTGVAMNTGITLQMNDKTFCKECGYFCPIFLQIL